MPGPKTVLLVDDDEGFRYAFARHLAKAGFSVLEARTSMEALKQIEVAGPVDCLVSDIHMPSGNPHGIALANMLRQRKPGLVVVFVTAFAEMAADAAELWGADKVFLKPVELDILTAAVKERCDPA